MNSYRLLTFATLAATCSFPVAAQQAVSPLAPISPSTSAPHPQKFTQRNIEYRTAAGNGMPGPHGDLRFGPPGMWWKNPDLVQKLTLTTDQQKRMDDIFQQSRLQLIDLKANVEKQEVTLEPMLSANPPDTSKVLTQIDHIASARAELEKANARMLLGIRGVLSADQWTKLQAERETRRIQIFRRPGQHDGPNFLFKAPDGPGGPGPESLRRYDLPSFFPRDLDNLRTPDGPARDMVIPASPISSLILPALPNLDMEIELVPEDDLDL